jgi:DNA helicase IV
MPATMEDPDSELTREQEHLTASRHALQAMRADVLSLEAMGGDPLSTEFLKADLYRRAEALRDFPDTPLFFGRLDRAAECLHIGRRHVHDAAGHPMVIDWRAPLARAFYKASRSEPMGVRLRRRFGFDGGELTAYEDEDLTGAGAFEGGAFESRILIEEIERPRAGPMRDIVATIQPEQDDIVRAEPIETVCVQGAPGTGKTAVGLHRVAYLLYAHRERMRRAGVLVIGPNRSFLGYIKNVLPALGELDVKQATLEELVAHVDIQAVDDPEVGRLKGDARMAEVLRRAVWGRLCEPDQALELPRGVRRWRVPAYELAEIVAELRTRGVRYGAGRDLLSHRIAHAVLVRMERAGEACDDRTHESVRRSRPVRDAVDRIWPKADPVRIVLRLLSDPEELAAAADGVLEPHEQATLRWARPARGPKSARWSAADAVLVDEAVDLVDRMPGLGHVVVDEAQDLSPMAARALGRRCATGAATVLGDIAQGTTPWAMSDWPTLLGHLGKPAATIQILERGYRVPRQIIDYASRLLPHIAPDLAPPTSVRRSPGALSVREVPAAELYGAALAACEEALAEPGSVGLVAADAQVPELAGRLAAAGREFVLLGGGDDGRGGGFGGGGVGGDGGAADMSAARLVLTPAGQVKGLEFDHVVVVEPAAIVTGEPRGLRRLYVVLTRAVSKLYVVHADPLPEQLR